MCMQEGNLLAVHNFRVGAPIVGFYNVRYYRASGKYA